MNKPEPISDCNCRGCIERRGDAINGLPRLACEMIVCRHCGDKRCVHAGDHGAPCAKTDIYLHNAWTERLTARLEEAERDAKRLDWMSEHEAYIGWNREGDLCRVWVRTDDEEDIEFKPVCGWGKFFDTARAAIDAAIKGQQHELPTL